MGKALIAAGAALSSAVWPMPRSWSATWLEFVRYTRPPLATVLRPQSRATASTAPKRHGDPGRWLQTTVEPRAIASRVRFRASNSPSAALRVVVSPPGASIQCTTA